MRITLFLCTAFALTLLFCPGSFADAPSANRNPRPCDKTDFVGSCERLVRAPIDASRDRSLGLPAYQDGSIVFNTARALVGYDPNNSAQGYTLLTSNPEILRISQSSAPHSARALRVAERVRLEAIEMITRGVRTPSLWSEEQRRLVERLRTLRFEVANADSPQCDDTTSPRLPNGSYIRNFHTVEICPAGARLAEPALLELLAHETGHAVQPCEMTRSVYSVVAERLTQEHLSTCSPDFAPANTETGETSNATQNLMTSFINRRPSHVIGNGDFYDLLQRCGILRPVSTSSLARRPELFSPTQICLENRERAEWTADVEAAVTVVTANSPGLNPQFIRRDLFAEHPLICRPIIQEGFADSFAARLVGRISESSNWSRAQVLAYGFRQASAACAQDSWPAEMRDQGYSAPGDRVRILSNDAAIASRLGCAEQPASSRLCPLQLSNDPPAGAGSGSQARPVRTVR